MVHVRLACIITADRRANLLRDPVDYGSLKQRVVGTGNDMADQIRRQPPPLIGMVG